MIPRLHIDGPLVSGASVALTTVQGHYLKTVLRCKNGACLYVFNGQDGEFAASLTLPGTKGCTVRVLHRTRAPQAAAGPVLFFAPVKRKPVELIIRQATETGVARFVPVMTEYTGVRDVNTGRLHAIAVEAAEQCGRTDIPAIDRPVPLCDLLETPPVAHLLYCDESGAGGFAVREGTAPRAAPAVQVLQSRCNDATSWGVLTGPEGGFSAAERAALAACSFVTPVTLGPRILKADTAALAALVLWQAILGDWQER